jgi:cell division protein FtsW (lipid II flippase)
VPWLCLVASMAVLCARDVGTSMVYWMSGAEASYFVGARSKTIAATTAAAPATTTTTTTTTTIRGETGSCSVMLQKIFYPHS